MYSGADTPGSRFEVDDAMKDWTFTGVSSGYVSVVPCLHVKEKLTQAFSRTPSTPFMFVTLVQVLATETIWPLK